MTKTSMIVSTHKIPQGFLWKIFSYITYSNGRYVATLFLLSSVILLINIIPNFKIFFLYFFILWFLLWTKLKNFFTSSLLIVLFTLPFYNPGKYYEFEILRSTDLALWPTFNSGYSLVYSLNTSTIFVAITALFSAASLIYSRKKLEIFNHLYVFVMITSSIAFVLVSIASSLSYSPYPYASILWLLQYCNLFLVASFLVIAHVLHNKHFSLLMLTIALSTTLQSVLAIWQFTRQSTIGLLIETSLRSSSYTLTPDQDSSVFRVPGTFLYHNELAFALFIYHIVLLSYGLREKKYLFLLFSVPPGIAIVLTQSRSAWSALLVSVFILLHHHRDTIKRAIASHRPIAIRSAIYLSLLTCGFAYIIIPRLLLTLNSTTEGAGISIRIKMIKEAFEAFQLNPFIGYGVGTNVYVLHTLIPDGYTSFFPVSIHMAFIQMLLEVGIVGLIFFVIPFLILLREIVNKKRSINEQFFAFIPGCVGIIIYYMIQPHVGVIEFSLIGIVLSFGFIDSLHTSNEKNT